LTGTAIELGNLIGTVSFSRKVSDGNYGGSDAFFALQFPIEQGDQPVDISRKANTAYGTCKAMVNAQLGLPVEDEIAAALIQDAFGPGVTVVENVTPISAAPSYAPAPQAEATVGPNPPFPGSYKDLSKDQNDANKEWAKARFASNPEEFFDNRAPGAKTHPKGPDIKHKATGVAAWFS
jgi:hypothetical protein